MNILNCISKEGCTAIELAILYNAPSDDLATLIEWGANIGVNRSEEFPIFKRISREVLELGLDRCIIGRAAYSDGSRDIHGPTDEDHVSSATKSAWYSWWYLFNKYTQFGIPITTIIGGINPDNKVIS